jgi:hypothetical protein
MSEIGSVTRELSSPNEGVNGGNKSRPKTGKKGGDEPGRLPIRIEHIWLAVPVLLVLCFGFLLKLRLFDFWWHLKIGEIIVNTRTIPRTDLFSFTAHGSQFILQNWLAEVIYYLCFRGAGLAMVVTLNALVLVAALIPVYALCRHATTSLRLSVVAALLPAAALLYFGSVRSQVFSFALFSIFYWVLSGYRSRRRNLIWALPLLMAVWVNLHGAFVLGLGLIAIFLVVESIRRLIQGEQAGTLSTREIGRLGIVLLASSVATLANPETYKLFSYVRLVATNPASQEFGIEWQPPLIDSREGLLLFFAPFFVTLIVLLLARRRLELIELVLFLTFAAFGMRSIRNGVWFSLIVAPIFARYLPTIDLAGALAPLRRLRLFDRIAQRIAARKGGDAPIRYRLNRQIAVLLLTITVLVDPFVYPHLGNKMFGNTLWERKTPVAAMTYIKDSGLEGRIFHPQLYGDYLIWRLWPQQRSFIDSRLHLFPDSVVEDYREAFVDSHWEERLAKYEIHYLLLSKTDGENQMLLNWARESTGWRVLYEDDESALFERHE